VDEEIKAYLLHLLRIKKLAQSDLPNLWKPRPDQFSHIDAFPYPGTGKLDLRKAREFAAARSPAQG